MTLGELIKQYRTEQGLSMEEFAKKSGLSKGYISMLEKNKNPSSGKPIVPTLETIKQVSSAMNQDFNYIISILDGNQKISLNYDYGIDISKIPGIMPLPYSSGKTVPLIGDIACGTPILADENIEKEVRLPDDISADFCLRCKGDSMINARIYDGDIVFIRQQPSVENGEIAAVLIDDTADIAETTLKRVYIYDSKVMLVAENPKYPPMSFEKEEMNSIRILGKAVAFLSGIR